MADVPENNSHIQESATDLPTTTSDDSTHPSTSETAAKKGGKQELILSDDEISSLLDTIEDDEALDDDEFDAPLIAEQSDAPSSMDEMVQPGPEPDSASSSADDEILSDGPPSASPSDTIIEPSAAQAAPPPSQVPDAGTDPFLAAIESAGSATDPASGKNEGVAAADEAADSGAGSTEALAAVDVPSSEELDRPPEMSPPEGEKPAIAPRKRLRFKMPELPRLPRIRVPFPNINKVKLGVSFGVGLFAACVSFYLLYGRQAQSPFSASKPDKALQATLNQAENLIREGEYVEAVGLLDPAMARFAAGDLQGDALFARFEAAYKLLPPTPATGQVEEALALFNKATGAAPNHPRAADALIWMADIYERAGVPLAARRIYDNLLSSQTDLPGLDRILVESARLALRSNDPAAANTRVERLLSQHSDSPLAGEARLLRGDIALAQGRRQEAVQIYEQIARLQTATRLGADAYTRLGRMAYDEGQYERAIRFYESRLESALTIEGNDQVYIELANAYRALGQLDQAQNMLRELIDFFPESGLLPDAYVLLSEILDDRGQREEAIRVAAQAAQRFPDNVDVVKHQATMLRVAGRNVEAANILLGSSGLPVDDPGLLLSAGQDLRKAGRLDEAREVLEHLVTTFPSAPESFHGSIELARALVDQGRITEGVRQLENLAAATEGTPQELPLSAALARLYGDLGLGERAAGLYGRVASLTTEPAMLAEAATNLFQFDAADDGLAVARRVDAGQLPESEAYEFLTAYGETLLRADASQGIRLMQQAHDTYPLQRTVRHERRLLEALLTQNQSAMARQLVMDKDAQVRLTPARTEELETLAVVYGDYLFNRGDYRMAAGIYSLATAHPVVKTSDQRAWARYQEANAHFQLGDFDKSAVLYDEVAQSKTRWSKEAKVKADVSRLEQRQRGLPVTPPPES
ncbi:MAG: tetratricopeptide repeat protein [Candidatus Hydrogenedentes bacterium]|nr:tetratricopeptide repeat protein [Candidatus Hydrogenedentota bacterium]